MATRQRVFSEIYGRPYLRVGKMRCRMGATISLPYLAWAAAMRACRCVASRVGESEGGSERRFDINFATWDGDKSAWSKEGCWHRDNTAFSKSRRMIFEACVDNSFRVGAETIDDASTSLSKGRRPTRSANRGRSKWRKMSPSPLSIPSRKRSARKGSRARRWVSCTSNRKVNEVEVSKADGAAAEPKRACECTMSRRMKWRYVSSPCCSDSYNKIDPSQRAVAKT